MSNMRFYYTFVSVPPVLSFMSEFHTPALGSLPSRASSPEYCFGLTSSSHLVPPPALVFSLGVLSEYKQKQNS